MSLTTYTITVNNQSGADQNYALFNQVPAVISSGANPKIWSGVFATAPTPAGSSAVFEISKQYFAEIATSTGSLTDGITVNITSEREVKLGKTDESGILIPGSTKQMVVNSMIPEFSPKPLTNAANADCFEMLTGHDFTVTDATEGK
jgi:hypothetical protein